MPTDRVPIYMWLHLRTCTHLAQMLEIPEKYVSTVFGDDIRQTWVGNNYGMEGIVHENENDSHTDFWQVKWIKKGDFNQVEHHPLSNASDVEISKFNLPFNQIDRLLKLMEPLAEFEQEYFIGSDISPCLFELYWRLCGMEQTIIDFVENPSRAHMMLAKCRDFSVSLAQSVIKKYKIDWVWTGDDIGSQAGMMISPAMWRELIKPRLKDIFEVIKSAGLFVAFHSCGSIRPIIPDLIEIGCDVLNPIQCNCEGMDPVELKKEYGKELSFMGGVDTQGVLPNGNAEQVYAATSKLIESMTSDGGGYILAASHTIPPETPDENIFAMYRAAGLSKEDIFDRAAEIRKLQNR